MQGFIVPVIAAALVAAGFVVLFFVLETCLPAGSSALDEVDR
jgi:hypothetical protein